MASLAYLRLAQSRPEEALAAARSGVDRYLAAGACGMFRSSFLLLAHAESLLALGLVADAAAAVARAAEKVRANAGKIGDPAYREGFLVRVPQHRRILALSGAAAAEPAHPA
jgi:tagatose-1,6-bisphosphate aldolase non-catalytic subunit AgaZ/GatZ